MSGQVIPLFPDSDDTPAVEKRKEPFCSHGGGSELDADARRVYCRECKRELDPVTALLKIIDQWDRYENRLRHSAREARVSAARVRELKRQERNAKARMRRAGIAVDAAAVRAAERTADSCTCGSAAARGQCGCGDPATVLRMTGPPAGAGGPRRAS